MTYYDPRQGSQPTYRPPPPSAQSDDRPRFDRKPAAPGKFEFTAAHRRAAALAHANGKVIVIDRGPAEPKPIEAKGEQTEAETAAAKDAAILAKRERDEWQAKNKAPVAVEMHKVDADHAVAADPERFIQVPRHVVPPTTVEERLTRLEQRLGPETAEEIEKRRERDAKIATDQAAQDKAEREKAAGEQKVF
jgi:hypothetical protein